MEYRIKTSYGQSRSQIFEICKEISSLAPKHNERLVFNFEEYWENSPFCNLMLINSIRQYAAQHPNTKLWAQPNNNTYLSHIGFYKAMGIPYGNEPGAAKGSDTYVPITDIPTKSSYFYSELEDVVKKLANTLKYDFNLEYMLKYVFRETIRNVHEHASTDGVLVAAQKWPTKDQLEIAIADNGIGIAGSLGTRFHMNNLELLKHACSPGISAQSNFATTSANDTWRNSGYGLYAMKELALTCKGVFAVCSGKNAVVFSRNNNQDTTSTFETDYSGLALYLQIRTNVQLNFYNTIPDIVRRGEKEAATIEGAIRRASGSSGAVY